MSLMANITPSVLAWARVDLGYTIDDVVEKLKQKNVNEQTVSDWEQGNSLPTYSQLEKLAKFYKRPLAVFFFPEPPSEEGIDQKFRSLPTHEVNNLSPQIRYLLRLAVSRQADLEELHGGVLPEQFQAFRNQIDRDISHELTAAQVRNIVGISLDQQYQWDNEDDALKKWRTAIDKLGIWVFKDAFKDDNYCGFCLFDDYFPVIYINNTMSKNRQIFTLFHELAHLIIGEGGVDFRSSREHEFGEEEVYCNAFAGAFLVPNESLELSHPPTDENIEYYAKRYKVSREVILRKYLDRREISQDDYRSKVNQWDQDSQQYRNKQKHKKGGGDYYASQRSYLGDKYLSLVFSKYYEQKIDQYRLSDCLGIKIKSIPTLEGYLLQGNTE